jgi:hypothetical protein
MTFSYMECTLEYFLLFYAVVSQNYFVKNASIINFYSYLVNLPSRLFFFKCWFASVVHSVTRGVFVFVI